MPNAKETKELILDTAERLFSEKGVDGVSLRSLTAEAGVNIAAAHYHFGSKEEVTKAVFARRIRPVNRERIQLLDTYQERGQPSVEELLTALFAPALRLAREPQRGYDFMRLCARFYSEPAEYLESAFRQEFSQVLSRFHEAFQRALPELAEEEVGLRLHFAIGVMVHTLLNPTRTCLPKLGPEASDSNQATLDAMVRFVAAGMRSAPAAQFPADAVAGLPAHAEVAQ